MQVSVFKTLLAAWTEGREEHGLGWRRDLGTCGYDREKTLRGIGDSPSQSCLGKAFEV